jgi:Zn-dependent protease with chaperone function
VSRYRRATWGIIGWTLAAVGAYVAAIVGFLFWRRRREQPVWLPVEHPLVQAAADLSPRAGMSAVPVLSINGSLPDIRGSVFLWWRRRLVATRGTAELLTPAEQQAMVAHGLAHISPRAVRDSLISSVLMIIQQQLPRLAFARARSDDAKKSSRPALMSVGKMILDTATRRRATLRLERRADAEAATLSDPAALANALEKLGAASAERLAAMPAGQRRLQRVYRLYRWLFLPTPTLASRTARLRAMRRNLAPEA